MKLLLVKLSYRIRDFRLVPHVHSCVEDVDGLPKNHV